MAEEKMSGDKKLLEVRGRNSNKLTFKEIRFIDEYMECNSGIQSVLKAGMTNPEYTEEQQKTQADNISRKLLADARIASEIQRRTEERSKLHILSSDEILELYTKIAKGEIADQFGMEASLKDRISALNELAKRQIDIPARCKAQQDNTLQIVIKRD